MSSSSSLPTSDQDSIRSNSSSNNKQQPPAASSNRHRQQQSTSFKFTMIPPLSRSNATTTASLTMERRINAKGLPPSTPPTDSCKENHQSSLGNRLSSPNENQPTSASKHSSTVPQPHPPSMATMTTCPTSSSSNRNRLLLRSGETLEEFFGMKAIAELSCDTEYGHWCQTVAYDSSAADDASLWKKILHKATTAHTKHTHEQQKNDNNSDDTPAWVATGSASVFNLMRLHRRATSRSLRNSASNPYDSMDVWLSYAQCQAKYGLWKDAQWSWQHVEPPNETTGGDIPVPAHYYSTVADLQVLQGNVDAARQTIQTGLARQAEPRSVLEQKLAQLLPPPLEMDPATTARHVNIPISPRKRPVENSGDAASSTQQCGATASPKRFKLTPSSNTTTTTPQQQLPVPSSFQLQHKRRPLATLVSTPISAPSQPLLSRRPTLPDDFARSNATPTPVALSTAPSTASSTTVLEARKPSEPFTALPSLRRPLSSVDECTSKVLDPESAATPSTSTSLTAPPPDTGKALHSTDIITPRRPPLAQRSVAAGTTGGLGSGMVPSSLSKVLLPSSSNTRRPLLGRTGRNGSLGMPQRVDPNFNIFALPHDNDTTDTITEALEEEEIDTKSPVPDNDKTNDEIDDPTTRSSDSNGKTPPRKVQLDISYMWDWDPNKTRPKSAEADPYSGTSEDDPPVQAAVVAPALVTTSTCPSPATPGLQRIPEGVPLSSTSKQPSPSPHSKLDVPDSSERRRRTKRHHSVASTSNNATSDAEASALLAKTNREFLPLVNEANIVRVNNVPYVKLGVIGKGGSCKVYRALSKDCSVVAIKKVKLAGMDKKSISGYANEIALLKRLRGNPAIIQMYDSEVDLKRKAIYVVMEQGETDLSHVLQQQQIVAQPHDGDSLITTRRHLNMNFIRLTWQQMLNAVHCIHEARIIHGDLKPPNFLFVRGALKLIDFGIAKAIQSDDTTNIYRESQIGTVNYMSPEAICGTSTNGGGPRIKIGRPSDVWSLGCILYQMVYGRTPFADLHMVQKLQAIINPNYTIPFPDTVDEAAIDVMRQCLRRKPEERPPIVGPNGLLNEHRFLNSRPHSSVDASNRV